jgi:hypothetical protein
MSPPIPKASNFCIDKGADNESRDCVKLGIV